MIEREVVQFVAEADWTDDLDVVLTTAGKRGKPRTTPLSASEARDLATELIQAADEVDRASGVLTRPTAVAAFDVAHVSPDCSAGKCAACIGTAWDHDADEMTNCTHSCHVQAEAVAA